MLAFDHKNLLAGITMNSANSATKLMQDAPPFLNAFAAVRFAATREGNPMRPPANRMLDGPITGDGFSVLDAAAQAGMILSVLRTLGEFPSATLIASAGVPYLPCECRRPCCCGRKLSTIWHQAIVTITHEAKTMVRKPFPVRSALVLKLYSGKLSFVTIAKDFDMDPETVSRHYHTIHHWLKGSKHEIGLETLAWSCATDALVSRGIVGPRD